MKNTLGLFDSGVGGFTVLKKVIERFGPVPSIYLADTARLPYGSKGKNEIRTIAEEIVNWFKGQNISAVLVACNTTNSLAMDIVEDLLEIPVLGLIDAGVGMIYEKRVGVLATPSTSNSRAYTKKILREKPDTVVLEQGCPAFVPMIEMGQMSSNELREIASSYLKPLLKADVEAVVLGCSHYPLLKPLLKQLLPQDVRLIDPAVGLAKKLDRVIKDEKFFTQASKLHVPTRFCVTSDPVGFASRAKYWLGINPEVELISLRSKACVF